MLLNKHGLLGPGLGFSGGASVRAAAGDSYDPPDPPNAFAKLWYDFTDITTIFQNTGATTAITAADQTINAITNKGSLSTNSNAISGFMDATGLTYKTDVINGYAGAQCLAASKQALIAGSQTLAVSEPYATAMLVVFRLLGTPSGTGYLFGLTDANPLTTVSATQCRSVIQKSAQAFTHGGTARDFATWAHKSLSPQTERTSINAVAGADEYVYDVEQPLADDYAIGGLTGGTSLWADQVVICEIMVWTESNLPSEAAMESYVTSKYGITWA